MDYEEDNDQEQEAPTNINGSFSTSSTNSSQGLPPNPFLTNPLDNPLLPTPILEEYNQSETPPMSPIPDYIAPNIQDTTEQAPKEYVDVNHILNHLQLAEGDPKLYEEDVPFEQLQEGVDYVILKSGETFYSIAAARTEPTVEQIKQWNPKAAQNSTKLPVGMRVLISGSAKNMGERVNTTGRIMGAEGQDVSLYQTASTSTPVSTVRYGTAVYIEKTDVSNTWYYVSVDGNKGWVERVFVTTNIPISDPEAELYYVTSGQTLGGIFKEKGYPSSKETSYWHYGRAASLLNPTAFSFKGDKAQQFMQEQTSTARGVGKLFIDEELGLQLLYNCMELKAPYHIWLPSANYTDQAKASGAIESRSDLMQGVIDVAEGVESFLQGARVGFTGRIEEELAAMKGMLEQLAAFAKDILGSVKAVLMDFWNYIKQFSIEQLLQTLLDGLIDPTLKNHLANAWDSLQSDDTEKKAKLWGLAAGAAVALGAIMVITRGGGKFLKVL
ncbi:MAG: LysM peptidoglycan-binding domain-containing protein, partial [Aureispira sp.]